MMVEAFLFFSLLALAAAFGLVLASPKSFLPIVGITAVTLVYLYTGSGLTFWLLVAILLFNLLPATSFSVLSASALLTAVAFAKFITDTSFGGLALGFEVPFFLAAIIAFIAIAGIFTDDTRLFLMASAAVQLLFVALEASAVAIAGGSLGLAAATRVLNYIVSGTIFAAGMVVLTRDGEFEELHQIHGCYYAQPAVVAAVGLSALSLAGIPGLNIFVSEWQMLTSSYSVSPAITVLAMFSAVTLFVMYMKIFYLMVSGERKNTFKLPALTLAYLVLLSLASIVLGLFPFIQETILGMVTI